MYLKLFTPFLLFTFGGWGCQLTNASRILALFINGHRSHLMIYTSVVNLLIDRGHTVTVITTEEVSDFFAVGDSLRWIKLSENYTKPREAKHGRVDRIESMMRRIEDTAEFMKDPAWQSFMQETDHYDLMILGYLFNDYQLGVAAHFKCPAVVLWTGQPIGFIHSLMGNPEKRWYVPQPYDRHQFKGFKAIAFGWFEKFIEMLALYKMKEIYDEHYPEPQYPSFWEIRKNVSLALCNHHSLSEGPIAPFVPSIIEIGGLEYKRTKQSQHVRGTEMEGLYPTQKQIIYFSFGSRVKWNLLDPDLERTFLKAFQAFPNHTIVWTYDKNCTELQVHSPTIHCNSWWPQTSILASNKTQLFITHGGKGSISEAYRYGKPILGFPFFGDQRANMAKVQHKKLGIKLNIYNLTSDDLVEALHSLLDHDDYTRNMAKYSLIYRNRPVTSEDSVIYWLEYVIRYRGARHLRCPALDLNLYEYYNLDVYVVLVLASIVLIQGCNWLEQKITNR